jgi:hypothetical protein
MIFQLKEIVLLFQKRIEMEVIKQNQMETTETSPRQPIFSRTSILIFLCIIVLVPAKAICDTISKPSEAINRVQVTEPIIIQNSGTQNSFIEKYAPAIAALFIGILSAVVNILIAMRLKRSNEKNLDAQIKHNHDMALIGFRSSIASKNRQEWINDLRNQISETIAQAARVAMESEISDKKTQIKGDHMQNLIFCHSKIQLMLNEEKPEQQAVLAAMNAYVNLVIKLKSPSDEYYEARNALIKASRTLFKIHWKKIVTLE